MSAIVEDKDQVANELTAAIDDALRWSSKTLASLIRIGEAKVYIDGGGPPEIVARRILGVVARVEEGAPELPVVLARVRRAAEAVVE